MKTDLLLQADLEVKLPDRKGLTVWCTGLSGSGKSTICSGVYSELAARGIPVEQLDGDIVRQCLTRDLGFSRSDRYENAMRIAFVAELLTRNGVVVLVSAISPYRSAREEARARIDRFLEVYISTPLEICEQRDPKGLYRKARAGAIQSFTGIDDPYEPPLAAEVECKTHLESPQQSIDRVISAIMNALAEA